MAGAQYVCCGWEILNGIESMFVNSLARLRVKLG